MINSNSEYDQKKQLAMSQVGLNNHCIEPRSELIQHRRANNIFDIGDKVVFKWVLESSDIFTIYSIDAYFIGVKRFEDDDFYYANINWGLKHATDAEIKAGHKL